MTEGLQNSLSLKDFELCPEAKDGNAYKEIGSPTGLLDVSRHTEFSECFGFDSRRICAAHNFVVVSKCADSVYMDVLQSTVSPFLQEDLEQFLVSVIRANPTYLQGCVIDQLSGLVRFRPHVLKTSQWAEQVLQSL